MGQNETNRHFELRDLDGSMRRASEEASRVISKKEAAQRVRTNALGTLLMLLTIIGIVIFLYFR